MDRSQKPINRDFPHPLLSKVRNMDYIRSTICTAVIRWIGLPSPLTQISDPSCLPCDVTIDKPAARDERSSAGQLQRDLHCLRRHHDPRVRRARPSHRGARVRGETTAWSRRENGVVEAREWRVRGEITAWARRENGVVEGGRTA